MRSHDVKRPVKPTRLTPVFRLILVARERPTPRRQGDTPDAASGVERGSATEGGILIRMPPVRTRGAKERTEKSPDPERADAGVAHCGACAEVLFS